MRVQLLLAAAAVAAMVTIADAGQGYLFPQSACRVHCQNGGACAYDTEDPSIHSCICLVGVYEGERCERLVPGAVDPAAAQTTTTTTTTTQAAPTTPSAYELERRRHEEQRLRIMEERRKHEEERKRIEEERRRLMEERARVEESRRAEMENRGREEEARRRAMEEDHRRRAEEERRTAEARRVAEERRRVEVEEEKRRTEEAQRMDTQQKVESDEVHEPTHKLDYSEYEDSLDGKRLEEVPDEKITADEDEDIDRVESGEMERPDDVDDEVDEEDDEEEEHTTTTPEPTKAVTYEVTEDDYVTSTTTALEKDKKKEGDDSKMSGEDDDYWDHTPRNPDEEELPPLPGASNDAADDEVVRGTQVDQAGRAVGDERFLHEDVDAANDEELEQDGDDGWMMVKRKQTASSSAHVALTALLAAVVARLAL